MFFVPRQCNRNIKWNSQCACFDTVWTHNPGTNSKTLSYFFQNAANRCLLYRICCLYCFISKSETNQKTSDIYLIAIQIGSGTPFMVKTSFKGNVVRIWQLAVSEKSEKSKEFHRRTKHFVNSHTQKLLSNPLKFHVQYL